MQVVIALIVTPEGFPLAYEVMAGNTADKTTLRGFLHKIEHQYGKAERVWVMDRGIPTEAILEEMRQNNILYLVGTPKGRLTRYESAFLDQEWHEVREGVEVKILPRDDEVYVLAQSRDRIHKERSIRRRQLKSLWKRLYQLANMQLTRDQLLLKLGAAKQQTPSAWKFVDIVLPQKDHERLQFKLCKEKLRNAMRKEGRYLLRTNLIGRDPADVGVLYSAYAYQRSIQEPERGPCTPADPPPKRRTNKSHIFLAFMAYTLHVTLRRRLRDLAPGLTPRAVLEKFGTVRMIDIHIPTTDGHTIIMPRYTQPEPELKMLVTQLKLSLPTQPEPRMMITARATQ